MKRYVIILTGMLAMLSACGESLEDTYREWAGDGEIRYLGKCTGLLARPGWQRMIVNWENNIDPAIGKIKVAWALDGTRDSVLLERGTTEYSIRELDGAPLGDGNYEISVSSVSGDGSASIPVTTYSRPYTYDHEEIKTFNLLVSKTYVVGDRLVLYFSPWQDYIREASLSYTKKNGSAGTLELTSAFFDRMKAENGGLYWLLEDAVDPASDIVLNRRAELPDCEDEIEFEPHVFDPTRRFDPDFTLSIESQLGYSEIPADWSENVETVYIDRSLGSFNSLLNLPKLTKLVLGGHRYLLPEAVNDAVYGQCSVTDAAASNFVLKVLNQLNGLVVERYNKHFPTLAETAYIEDKGAPTLPYVTFIDLSGRQFTEQPKSETVSGLPNLTDADYSTYWNPSPLSAFTAYELTLDMGTPRTIGGLCFVQRKYDFPAEIAYAPEYAAIRVSNDGLVWEDATYVAESRLGKSNGEINYIPFADDIRASTWRYVQVRVNAMLYGTLYRSAIGEIGLY